MDVAAHQHNSILINELLTNSDSPMHEYYAFNPILVPNLTGHVILSLLMLFLSASSAVKVFVMFIGIFFFFGFRKLVNQLQPGAEKFSWIVFPLLWNTFIHYGFFNFALSIPFALYALYYLIECNKSYSNYKLFCLALYLGGIWFSHVATFFITCVIALFIQLNYLLEEKRTFRTLFVHHAKIVLAFLPFLWLTYKYFSFLPSTQYVYIDKKTITEMYFQGSSLFSLGLFELNFVYSFFAVLGAMLVIGFSYLMIKRKLNLRNTLIGAGIVITVIGLTYYLPDADGRGGYMTMRMILFTFVVLCVIATLLMRELIVVRILLSIIALVIALNWAVLKQEKTNELDFYAKQIEELEKDVEKYATVFVFDAADSWLIHHFSNHLGIHKPIMIYENYECQMSYFPLVWKKNHYVEMNVEITTGRKKLLQGFDSYNELLPKYVLIFGESKERRTGVKNMNPDLDSIYHLKRENNFAELYEKR